MDIKYNKGLGQNFIFDTNLLRAIATDAEVSEHDIVLEIGAGAGTLTQQLAQKAKRVISFEIDRALKDILEKNLSGLDNVELIFADFMGFDIEKRLQGQRIKVVANLPYYITTPILFRLIESDLEIESITILVQKEVAERIVASSGTKDFGALSLTVSACFDAKITRIVRSEMFTPRPKVDSALVHLKFREKFDKSLNRTIRALFAQRRKTAANNMTALGITKEQAQNILQSIGENIMVRAEQLPLEQVKKLHNCISANK